MKRNATVDGRQFNLCRIFCFLHWCARTGEKEKLTATGVFQRVIYGYCIASNQTSSTLSVSFRKLQRLHRNSIGSIVRPRSQQKPVWPVVNIDGGCAICGAEKEKKYMKKWNWKLNALANSSLIIRTHRVLNYVLFFFRAECRPYAINCRNIIGEHYARRQCTTKGDRNRPNHHVQAGRVNEKREFQWMGKKKKKKSTHTHHALEHVHRICIAFVWISMCTLKNATMQHKRI